MKLNSVTANSKWSSLLFQIELKQYYEVGAVKFILFIDLFIFAHFNQIYNGLPVKYLIEMKLNTFERLYIYIALLQNN